MNSEHPTAPNPIRLPDKDNQTDAIDLTTSKRGSTKSPPSTGGEVHPRTPAKASGERYTDGHPDLVDEHAGAEMCGVSFWTFRGYIAAGLIPHVELPSPLNSRRKLRRKLVDPVDIRQFIQEHKTGGAHVPQAPQTPSWRRRR
jgi:hypothetical protein